MSGAIGSYPIGDAAVGSSSISARPMYVGSGAIGTYSIGGSAIGGTFSPYLAQFGGQSLGDWLIIMRRRFRR